MKRTSEDEVMFYRLIDAAKVLSRATAFCEDRTERLRYDMALHKKDERERRCDSVEDAEDDELGLDQLFQRYFDDVVHEYKSNKNVSEYSAELAGNFNLKEIRQLRTYFNRCEAPRWTTGVIFLVFSVVLFSVHNNACSR